MRTLVKKERDFPFFFDNTVTRNILSQFSRFVNWFLKKSKVVVALNKKMLKCLKYFLGGMGEEQEAN